MEKEIRENPQTEQPTKEAPANPRRPIVAIFAIGVALIVALSFVPYTLLPFQQPGEPLAILLPSGARDAAREAKEAAPTAAPEAPSFDVAAWYASRQEEPEKHGVLIESMDGRKIFASHNAETPFNPASLVKLSTTLAALRKLGADHRFETRVYTEGATDAGGTLRGKIYVATDDPAFGDTAAALIARELRARGITRATDGLFVAPGFSFNFNESADDSARNMARVMKLELKGDGGKKGARGEQAQAARENGRRRDRKKADERAASPDDEEAAMNEGEEKKPSGRKDQSLEGRFVAAPPAGQQPLFILHSHPLRDVLLYMNAHSSNFIAERIGAMVGGPQGVRQFLIDEIKIPADQVMLSTTSGLEYNRMTPTALISVIRALHEETKRRGLKLEDIMPIVSSDYGTLRRRLQETPLKGAAVGKTGTLAHDDGGMASIAGVVFTQREGMILFAILDQGHTIWEHRQLEEQLLSEVIMQHDQPVPLPIETPRRLLPQTNFQIEGR